MRGGAAVWLAAMAATLGCAVAAAARIGFAGPVAAVLGAVLALAAAGAAAYARGRMTGGKIEALAGAWGASVREAFLLAYAASAHEAGLPFDADRLAADRPLLALFELDAALQDLNCELIQPGTASGAALASLPALAALVQA